MLSNAAARGGNELGRAAAFGLCRLAHVTLGTRWPCVPRDARRLVEAWRSGKDRADFHGWTEFETELLSWLGQVRHEREHQAAQAHGNAEHGEVDAHRVPEGAVGVVAGPNSSGCTAS